MSSFKLVSKFFPAGDQIKAISELLDGINSNNQNQVLLGVTGSGKTFTMANVIEKTQRPTIIIAHNKTLAAQLYEEMKGFFPDNAVEYFVSYYDYYQPEAYIPQTDTFIEKDSAINDKIDLLRHSATRSLLERKDVIVVSSVSCIYGLGAPELYMEMTIPIKSGQKYKMNILQSKLVELQYTRSVNNFARGSFRVQGDVLDIFPSHYENRAWRLSFFGDDLESITEFDPLTGSMVGGKLDKITVFSKSHYVTPRPTILQAIDMIKQEVEERVTYYRQQNKIVEAQRIEQRAYFDIEMLRETGHCKGIENYSRYLSGKLPGQPPPTLFEYLPKDSLMFVDESHVTVPQISAMYNGDRARKSVLIHYGFRLPSALDNRPLKFEEWEGMRPATIYVSATPGKYELEQTGGKFTEQIIRPTGLLDPICIVKPASTQVNDVINESIITIKKGYRVLITALTKKIAEDLTEYMKELDLKVMYLHSDVQTLDRIETIYKLRKGNIDILVGVNLLREGLDIPECGMVAILDADKEGFLRSTTSLIQTIGRAARNAEGRVILYADKMTESINLALKETERRRAKQQKYNDENNIVPVSINKPISNSLYDRIDENSEKELETANIHELTQKMLDYAENLEFEKAAEIRDKLDKIKKN